jgi:hypothetical protein
VSKTSLEKMLAACTPEMYALSDEDREWESMRPVGMEDLDVYEQAIRARQTPRVQFIPYQPEKE